MAGIFNIFKSKLPEELFIDFEGFKLCYSEGTSIVERYKRDGSYEADFIEVLVSKISTYSGEKAFLDIGANIGMISLSMLKAFPNMKIYSFEPGPHQADLFEKTIQHNQLEDKIALSRLALKNEKGIAHFSVHSSEDVSGDGFIDTERAGKTKKIQVDTDLLDNWWNKAGKPFVPFVKMDTEGSELWILQGAKEFISACRPMMFLEINDKNIRNYPYEVEDLMSEVESLNYKLKSLNEEEVTRENIMALIKESDTFIAYPQ